MAEVWTPGMMIPEYETNLFTDIYSNVETFMEDYKNNGIPALVKDESVQTLFYLLYARYGNNPISNLDVNQFKYKLFSTIFQYGPTWEKKLEIQTQLRSLSLEQAASGAKAIMNHAFNPGTAPSTQDTDELNYVNDQNVSKFTKSPLEAANGLWYILKDDVTEDFIQKFRYLFSRIPTPQNPTIYTTVKEV